jgi:hypothetical protein
MWMANDRQNDSNRFCARNLESEWSSQAPDGREMRWHQTSTILQASVSPDVFFAPGKTTSA